MAADALLDARPARDHVHDLVGALARDGLGLMGGRVLHAALKGVFVALAPGQQAVDIAPRGGIDQDARLLAGLLRLDLGVILPARYRSSASAHPCPG